MTALLKGSATRKLRIVFAAGICSVCTAMLVLGIIAERAAGGYCAAVIRLGNWAERLGTRHA